MRISRLLLVFFTIVVLSACSIFSSDDENLGGLSGAQLVEKELYELAIRSLESNQSRAGIEYLQILEEQFPFGAYAEQAQLEIVYAYYRAADYDASMSSADRFIRLHPEHPNVDYAYYMRGLISFTRDSSFFGQFLPVDISKRDPGSARESYSYFSELLLRFPESPYGEDARKRLIYLRNLLARHEINVANYYFERGAYLGATNRGRYVVENFQGSPAVADGLAVMAQGYTLMGYDELASNSVAVLHENFPDHPALDIDGNLMNRQMLAGEEKTLLNRLSFGLLNRPQPLGYDTRELYNPEYMKSEEAIASNQPVEEEDDEAQVTRRVPKAMQQRNAILPPRTSN